MQTVADRDRATCPSCGGVAVRQVCVPAMRGDVFDWSNENNGKGRYIGQLQRTLGKKVDPSAYCKNRQAAIDKAHKRGYSVDKSAY